MKTIAHRLLTLLLLMVAMVPGCLCAQNVEMVDGDTVYIYNCRNHYGSLSTPYASSISSSFDGWAILESYGADITLQFYSIGQNSHLQVWTDTVQVIDNYGTYYPGVTTYSANRIIIHFVKQESDYASFTATWNNPSGADPCTQSINNISVSDITPTSAHLHWDTDSPPTIVEYNGVKRMVSGNSLPLTGLSPNTTYDVSFRAAADSAYPCCSQTLSFTTSPRPCIGCPDVTDFSSSYCQGFYGTFYNPYNDVGIVDEGPQSSTSRHTIHTDPNERDFLSQGQLPCVYPGASASVRLGNWSTGAQAEALSYMLHVDTLFYSLLILHYAVVFENPNHNATSQPRFRMEILNSNGNVIDPVCGVTDFVANSSLGWHTAPPDILWKDWTTVGFDLTPYHGQDIILRFTTYDCSAGGHYGYAYFTTECMNKNVSSESCGIIDSNTVYAPEGFLYRWYSYNVNHPLSTQRSFSYANYNGYYHCRLTSTENPSCHVTIHTYASNRWPQAAFEIADSTNNGCDGYRYTFINRSRIVGDYGDSLTYHENCESAHWDFGDGETSSEYSTQHTYYDGGTYQVSLVSGIGGDECIDSVVASVTVPDLYAEEFISMAQCDSLRFDTLLITSDTLFSRRTIYPKACDSVFVYDFIVDHSASSILPADTFCYSNTYAWEDTLVGSDTITQPTHYQLEKHYSIGIGCDSAVYLLLVQLPPDTLHIKYVPDCIEKRYRLTACSPLSTRQWESTPHDSCLDGHEFDSIVLVSPKSATSYTLTTDYGPSTPCPTSTSVTLLPVTFPTAVLETNPDYLTYKNLTVDAYDRSRQYDHRRWSVVLHSAFTDTLPLPDTSRTMRYIATTESDSLTVLLAVSNNICYDTARRSIPILKSAVFVPNIFTPSQDINSRFTIISQGLLEAELTIYNRQGLFVFSTTDLEQGWDGTHDGVPCSQGAYVWHLHYRTVDRPEQWNTQMGTVTLLR